MALVNQTEAVRKRRRTGRLGIITVLRGIVVSSAVLGAAVFVLWLKQESPHSTPAIAVRESPLVQAQSLKSPLQTVQSSALAAYGLKKNTAPTPTPAVVLPPPVQETAVKRALPVWLLADLPEFAVAKNPGLSPARMLEQLRQSLRDSGGPADGTGGSFWYAEPFRADGHGLPSVDGGPEHGCR